MPPGSQHSEVPMRYGLIGVNNYWPEDNLKQRFAAAGHWLVWSVGDIMGAIDTSRLQPVQFAIVVHNCMPPIVGVWQCMGRLASANMPPTLMCEKQLDNWLAEETEAQKVAERIRRADLDAARVRAQSNILERVAAFDNSLEDECLG